MKNKKDPPGARHLGVLYGVGVGPGDPELMTLKSVRVLEKASVIAVPRASEGGSSTSMALEIVRKSVDVSGKEILELLFPMTRDGEELKASRRKAATEVSSRLREGKDVAFVTLGDPMLYSTFSYLSREVGEMLPGIEASAVPGVTSMTAVACSALRPVAEGEEKVIIVPASCDTEELKWLLKAFDTIVLIKVGRNIDRLAGILTSLGLERNIVYASRVGWEGSEFVTTDLRKLKGKKGDYFSMVIVRKGRG